MTEITSARSLPRPRKTSISRILCGLVVLCFPATVSAQLRHSATGSAPSMRSAAPHSERSFGTFSGSQNGGGYNGGNHQAMQPMVNYSQADLPGQQFGNHVHGVQNYGNSYFGGHQHYGNTFHSGAFYGGIPYYLPPVYVRNRDQAVFFPPLVGGNAFYGYGSNFGYGAIWPSYSYLGYSWPCYSSCFGSIGILPTYGCSSWASQSFGVFPAVLNLNVTASRASYSRTTTVWAVPTQVDELVDSRPPRMRVTPAPAAGEFPFDLPVATEPVPRHRTDFNRIPVPAGVSAIPVIDEFPPIARSEKTSSLTQRIHSLRYQSSGDEAFRKSDYPTAEVFYRSAIEAAPDRRAPWFRMAFAHLARQKFDTATAHLKTGLLLKTDISRAWITAAELYGAEGSAGIPDQAVALWDWAAAEPLSTDRLLLTAAFQFLRGDQASADELLSLAGHNGPEEALLSEMRQVSADDIAFRGERNATAASASGENTSVETVSGQSDVAVNAVHDRARFRAPQTDVAAAEPQRSVPDATKTGAAVIPTAGHVDGIFMRGRNARSAVKPGGDADNVRPVPEPLVIPLEDPVPAPGLAPAPLAVPGS